MSPVAKRLDDDIDSHIVVGGCCCVAGCSSVLQYVAVCCGASKCVAVHEYLDTDMESCHTYE